MSRHRSHPAESRPIEATFISHSAGQLARERQKVWASAITQNRTAGVTSNRRCGFTLIEVMLALTLVSLVLVAVAMAINFNLRMLDSGRTQVEEAQLGRAILQRIADDLRGAVAPPSEEEDDITLPNMSDMAGDTEGAMAGGGGDRMGGDGGAMAGDASSSDDTGIDNTGDLSGINGIPTAPGLYGNHYQLQVDTCRLPRLDEYSNANTSFNEVASIQALVSDIKTVTYCMGSGQGSSTGVRIAPTTGTAQGGLVRRELDRAASVYASESGQLSNIICNDEPIAPEVAAIQFEYFDGTEWATEWDSQERGGLPVAVEVSLFVVPRHLPTGSSLGNATANGADTTIATSQLLIYRLLVHLPAGQPTSAGETSGALDALVDDAMFDASMSD